MSILIIIAPWVYLELNGGGGFTSTVKSPPQALFDGTGIDFIKDKSMQFKSLKYMHTIATQ